MEDLTSADLCVCARVHARMGMSEEREFGSSCEFELTSLPLIRVEDKIT